MLMRSGFGRTKIVWALSAAVSVAWFAAPARAQDYPAACGAGGGDCCSASRAPGCQTSWCCAAVCACDPFCCDDIWDEGCATTGHDGNGCGAVLLCDLCVDTDGDGVSDVNDVCCETPAGLIVDESGRPVADADRDCDVDLVDAALLQRSMSGPLLSAGSCCAASPAVCDDGDACTVDSCDDLFGTCRFEQVVCDEGEICDPETGQCRPHTCAVDSDCDDGLFCNGPEQCHAVELLCNPGTEPCGREYVCDEGKDSCTCTTPTFTLTTAVDNIDGTMCDDTFDAPLGSDSSRGITVPTLQTGDVLNGSAGSDTLNATFNFAAPTTVAATLIAIESMNFTDLGSAQTTIDAMGITDVETINNVASTSVHALHVTNLSVLVRAGITDSDAGGLVLSFTASAMSGAADILTLTLRNVAGGSFEIQRAELGDFGVETLAISSNGDGPNTLAAIYGPATRRVTVSGDSFLSVLAPLGETVDTVAATSSQGGVALSTRLALGPVNFSGSQFDDVFEGSAFGDVIVTRGGNDVLRPGKGVDFVNVGTGSDILDLSDLGQALTAENRVVAVGMLIDGSEFTPSNEVDALRFGNVTTFGDLSDGATSDEFQVESVPGSKVLGPDPVAVLELDWEFSHEAPLATSTDGGLLLGGLGALSGLTPGQIDVGTDGRSVLIIAYQFDSAFVYLGDEDVNDGDTLLSASEIAQVCWIQSTVPQGGFEPSNFQ